MYWYFNPFYGWRIFLCMRISHVVYTSVTYHILYHIHPFIQWYTLVLFPLFGYCEQRCYEHLCKNFFEYLFSILLDIYLWVKLVGHVVILTFRGISELFSTLAAPFYIPTTHVQGFQCLHILANIYFPLFKIIAIWWVWSGISLWFWFAFPWWLMF